MDVVRENLQQAVVSNTRQGEKLDLVHVGRLPVLRARMHNDLHMADRLSAGSKMVNLFVSFGEPDIQLRASAASDEMYEVEILGMDIFNPRTGEVRASDAADIACWMIDTD